MRFMRGPKSIGRRATVGEREAARLLAWYRRRRRNLPWRGTKDPYAIWVSEVMLQQTRVAAAVPYYERFLDRFPDVGTLARARLPTVLRHWAGLGYYRRARNLHAAARVVARSGFPRTAQGWRALPGVGAYTSAAVASIAFREPVAVVDGNVARVLCRLHALPGGATRIAALAQTWLRRDAPGDFNQAVMELGATICTPRAPSCDACPLADACCGRHEPSRYPAPRPRPRTSLENRAVAFEVRGGRVLLRQYGKGERLEGLWDLPEAAGSGRVLGTVRHTIVDCRMLLSIHAGGARGGGTWVTRARLSRLPLTAAARKCLDRVGFFDDK
ncbi:MAG: A/G-specific adenine glycosylase [Planctomycetaceae bacterium]